MTIQHLLLGGILLMSPLLSADDVLKNLRPEHPRLLLPAGRSAALRSQLETDPVLRAQLDRLKIRGEALRLQKPLEYKMEGYRLLSTSREALRRLLLWNLLHQIEPDPRWPARAREEILALCAFPSWNPEHFLDVGEMAAAVAIGYDGFYADLSEEDRAIIRAGLKRLALEPGQKGGWWVKASHNWNPVCHAGLSLAALAIAEHETDLSRLILEQARTHLPLALDAYEPDGVHPESPAYWDYGSGFFVLLAMALDTALGDDWGISAHEGFRKSFDYRLHVIGPGGQTFNYGDGNASRNLIPFHFWMGARTGHPGWTAFALNDFVRAPDRALQDRLSPLALMAWPASAVGEVSPLPTAYVGKGKLELVSLRSAWTDPMADWVALRAGSIQVNHAHMDLGTFVLESGGVRWAHDLGQENAIYARKDGWALDQSSKRWNYLRASVHSHNTLVLDGEHQTVDGHCPILDHGDTWAEIDLLPAYPGKAAALRRRVALDQGFRITDTLEKPGILRELRWQMVTRADVEIAADGRSARLRENKQTLRVELLSPAPGATFREEPLTPATPEEDPNPGFRRLVLVWPAPLPDPAIIDLRLQRQP